MSGAGYGRIGQYELRGVLGRGGMATVYRAYAPQLRREVAVKVLTAPEDKIGLLRERFRREAQVVGRLNHPNILPLLDSGEENGIPYLVMDLIEGGALNSRLGRPLPPEQALSIARQIGSALDYAHERGIVHRDVKPANIFLAGQRAVLADFGIVKVFGEIGPRLTQTGVGVGTPEYTAPEQATGAALDGRADLYALGIVLYEMLTGTPPYQGGTMDVINAHVQGQLPDPRQRNPALPPAVSAVLVKALSRQPAGRYPTGAALADALESAIGGTRPVPQPPAEAPPRTMILDRTREILLDTQIHRAPLPLGGDATVVIPAMSPVPPRPTAPQPPAALPPTPAALPPVPTRPAGADDRGTERPTIPGARPATPAPEPPRALPQPPIIANQAHTPSPLDGASRVFAPPGATLPPLNPPAPAAPAVAPPVNIGNDQYGPVPLTAPAPPPTPPPPQRSSNRPLLIGLAAALVLLLALVGVGGYYFTQRDTPPTPTVSPVAQTSPTLAPTAPSASAPANATPVLTPTPPSRAATATAAAASDPARDQIAAADTALQEGRFTDAVDTYKAALATNPNSAIANRQLGLALWVWNHEPGEIDYLDKATQLNEDDPLAWAYYSFSSVDVHQPERAYHAAQQAVRADDQEAVAWAAIANSYVRYPPNPADPQSGLREGREAIDRARSLDPESLWVLWVEHIVLAYEEKYQEALVPLDKMIAQRPNWATLYTAKGGTYRALENFDEARRWQGEALRLDPDYPYALTELGWLAYWDGDNAQARTHFEKALVLTDETNIGAHAGLGYTLFALGDTNTAIRNCERAASIDARQPDGPGCLGYLHEYGTQDYGAALSAYRKVIALRPYWELGHVGVGRVQARQGDYAAAEATLKQGINQVLKPEQIHYWLGWVLFKQGKYQEAQPNLERAAQLLPNDPVVQLQLGQNLEQLQRLPEARAAYERALQLDPDNEEARAALDRLGQQGR